MNAQRCGVFGPHHHVLATSLRLLLITGIFIAVVVSEVSAAPPNKPTIVLLDVDNTLYVEKYHKIEAQIVKNIHRFATDASAADDLHRQFGSTVEGLRQTAWKDLSPEYLQEKQRAFYEAVYSNIDCTSLLQRHQFRPLLRINEVDDGSSIPCTKSGYSHCHDGVSGDSFYNLAAQQHAVRRILKSAASSTNCELHIASNSPVHHIQRVIQAAGLTQVPWKNIWTPDQRGSTREVDSATTTNAYPTKRHPREFFGSAFLDARVDANFIDDSATTLAACDKETRFRTIHLSSNGNFPASLQQAWGVAMGWLSPNYQFSDVDYLRAKNIVDRTSICRETWMQTISELNSMLSEHQATTLTIVDVGAGLLTMLRLILEGFDNDDDNIGSRRLPSMLGTLQQNGTDLDDVHYYAFEPNQRLKAACVEQLESLGFSLQSSLHGGKQLMFLRLTTAPGQPNVTVHLHFWDYKEHPSFDTQQPAPHLIVGCCFADLFEPYDLVTSLMRCFLSNATDGVTNSLIYFPITFGGVTQFLPPQPFESLSDHGGAMVPCDTKAFAQYSKALTESNGHNLDPDRIESAMADYGATCLGLGKSDWFIDPHVNDYLWRTMLYFFGTVAGPELQAESWNARAWLDRARRLQPTIHVTNVDLLFRVPRLGKWSIAEAKQEDGAKLPRDGDSTCQKSYDEILFTGPRQVTSVQKVVVAELQPNEIRIQTECSLISSGTELKIFKGSFDDAALDVNIKGMDDERMTYPLAYGYSLVGRVVGCGSGVEDADELLGRRVFTFSAHASQAVTDRSAVQLVPDDIAALDAVFLPSLETALSLVQDARPIFGENIAIFGQGLIGLLVTALLRQHATGSSGRFGAVSTFDTLPDRLAASASMGASQALFPTESSRCGPFDLVIEVSGNSRALQAAIDSTRNGGRIVIGSWYGNEDLSLKLGIDFHRSHKTIKASQVSEIPAELSRTWTKERRFALTWELVKSIRPSQLVTRRTSLDHAQEAYDALENGSEIAIAFEYR